MSIAEITAWPGGDFPTVSVKKGHCRIATSIGKDGTGYWMYGFSNIPVYETDMNYDQKPGELIVPLYAMKINEPESAELLAATFAELAEIMKEGRKNHGTDDSGNEP